MLIVFKDPSSFHSFDLIDYNSHQKNSSSSRILNIEIIATCSAFSYLHDCYTKNNRQIKEIEILLDNKVLKYNNLMITSDLTSQYNFLGQFVSTLQLVEIGL